MAQERYFLGPGLLGDIRRTIATVDGQPTNVLATPREPRPTEQGASAQVIRVGEFTGTWNKGDLKTVTWTPGGTIAATVEAKNLFWDVGEAGTATSSCAIGRVGSTWYLIAAEQEFAGGFHMGEFNGSWSKGATKTVNILRTGGQLTAKNSLINLSTTITDCTTTVAIAKDGTAWHLVAFEMVQKSTIVLNNVELDIDFNTSNCAITVNQTNHTVAINYIQVDMCGNG